MNAWNLIGRLVLGLVITSLAVLLGIFLMRNRKFNESTYSEFMTPKWLLIVEIAIVSAIGFFLYQGYWTICGIWSIGGLILGYLVESIAWRATSKEKTELWFKNAVKKAAENKQILAEEECRKSYHQMGPWNDTDNICVQVCKCTRCGMEQSRDSGKHPWGEWKAGGKTCQKIRVCANCGQKEEKDFHDFRIVKEWIDHSRVDKFPDGRPSGKYYQITQRKCERCRAEQEEELLDYVVTRGEDW